jgi:hypothetical protein
MEELVMLLCLFEIVGCVATGPQAVAFYARRRERRDFPRATASTAGARAFRRGG